MDRSAPPPGRRAPDDALTRSWYEQHAAALQAYAAALSDGDRHRAQDLVQETLLRAWQHREQLAADGRSPRPWLFTVTRNLAMDVHRARRARPVEVAVASELLEVLAADDELDRRLDALLVGDALATLSPAHRAVLDELYYAGASVAQAATRLGVPQGTVKSRAYYALRALRGALEERGR